MLENKRKCDRIFFSGDKMKKQYLIYADESHRKGKYYSNFYGGALVNYNELEIISNKLNLKKEELGLFQEIKWTKVTEQYLDKYLLLVDYFFKFVKDNKIKIRIMFRQNALVPQNLTREHEEKEYFLLYYQFIKHAFGIDYCNQNEKDKVILKLYFDKLPDTKRKNKVFKGYIYALNDFFCINNVHIYNEDIAEVDSKNHVILQCMDVILGAMNFKLNNMDKEKIPGSYKRGKRTIAKEKLYKNILKNIKSIYPNFNIGVSTSYRNDITNNWKDPYRHWCFKSKNSVFDSSLTKKAK
ncbi:putative uncharacterized protein [Clostridium sp. CAG:628]|nr:putative uncharacterized protein [Clostridium sp. CAG:628]